jgi:hypothetical protein
MRYTTAVGHLRTIGEEASDYHRRLDGSDISWPLTGLWVGGELLDGPPELELATIVLVLDEPAAEVPWLALNRAGEWIADQLRLPKLPLRWFSRPLAYPAWSHEVRRVVRFWSAASGLDREVIEHLRLRRFDALPIVRPSPAEFAAQLATDLADSRRHLRDVLDRYWDRGWRGERKGFGINPEDHLWRAAQAVREIEDAAPQLDVSSGPR